MTTIDRQALEAQLHAVLEQLMTLPRHPRGYQGAITPLDLVLVPRFQGADGRTYIAEPAELEPDQGETPVADIFLRDYSIVGTRRGTSLVDVLTQLAPVIAPGAVPAGGKVNVVDLLVGLFRKR